MKPIKISTLFLLAIPVLLSGCVTTTDPGTDAGFINTAVNVWGGGYQKEIDSRQAKANKLKSTNNSLEAQRALLKKKKNARAKELATARRRLDKLNRDIKATAKTIGRLKKGVEIDQDLRAEMSAKMNQLQNERVKLDQRRDLSRELIAIRKKGAIELDKIMEIWLKMSGGKL